MSFLRQYIREVILETRFNQMTKAKYRDLEGYLANAPFLDEPADVDELDYDFPEDYDDADNRNIVMRAMLPVQEQLAVDLGEYFMDKKRFKGMADGRIEPHIEVNDNVVAGPGEAEKVLAAANYYYDEPMHTINIQIGAMQPGLTYRDLGPEFVPKLAQVIRHELLHMNQFLKFSKGKPTQELWDEFMKGYNEAQSGGWKDEPYFTSDLEPSEREAFAHQIADELVHSQGPKKASQVLTFDSIPHEQLLTLSSSYKTVTRGLEDHDTPGVRDMLKRAKQYAKKIGRNR